MNNPYVGASAGQKYSTILFTLLLYLKLLFFPHPLTHDYYPWQVPLQSPSGLWVWVAVLVTGGLVWLAYPGVETETTMVVCHSLFFHHVVDRQQCAGERGNPDERTFSFYPFRGNAHSDLLVA